MNQFDYIGICIYIKREISKRRVNAFEKILIVSIIEFYFELSSGGNFTVLQK